MRKNHRKLRDKKRVVASEKFLVMLAIDKS